MTTLNKYNLPAVSIITSVLNGDKYLEGFLSQITKQDFFKKCELILVNPNSPGNEEAVIKKYLLEFPNIIYKKLTKTPVYTKRTAMALKLPEANAQ